MTYVGQDDAFYTFPIHNDDVQEMPDAQKIYSELNDSQNAEPTNFEDYWIGLVGNTLCMTNSLTSIQKRCGE